MEPKIMVFKFTIVLFLNSKFCAGMDKELVIETSDGAVTRQSEGRETTTFSSPKMNLKEAHEQTEIANKAVIVVDDKKNPVFVQTLVYVQPKEGELEKGFKVLNSDISEISKFYSYYKVLIYIDKSLGLIREFKDTIDINVNINSMIRQKKIDLVVPALKNTEDLCREVKELFCKKKCKLTPLSHQQMLDKLCSFEKKIEFLKQEFERYNHDSSSANDYNRHNNNKCKELGLLQKQFENVRKVIYPMKEEDMKKHTELFKNNLLNVISVTYQNLKQCHKKEKTNLKWYYDILEVILKKTLTINEEIKEIYEILIADDTKQE